MKNTSCLHIIAAIWALLMLSMPSSAQQSLIHFWYLDDNIPNNTPLTELNATYSIAGENVKIEYLSALEGYPFTSEHPNWRKASMERRNNPTAINYRPIANSGFPYDAEVMRGLQVKQPFTGDAGENTMIFHLPTAGFENIVFMFAAINEGAADALMIDYSYEEATPQWSEEGLQTTVYPLTENFSLFTVDFSPNGNDIEAANNNPHFKIRIRFQGENMDIDEGNRVTFNNFSLDGTPLSGTNQPPYISNPVMLQTLIEDASAATIDLNTIFSDPENDPLTFNALSNNPSLLQAQINGNSLSLSPQSSGDANITLTASDGENPETSLTFRTLVLPAAFDLGQGDFLFDEWHNNQPDYSYPENMIFLQSDISDPGVNNELLFPYYIPHDDYHADDQATIGFPYNNTSRTRINGLGAGGITFINTGRDRDLGGAMVALNTTGQSSLHLSFKAGTMLQNSRLYAIRLQYRTETEGSFNNLLINGLAVEYIAATDGDLVSFENIELPLYLMGHEYLQLLWRYYHYSGDSGPRAMLRLDDIVVQKPTDTETPDQPSTRIYAVQNRLLVENSPDEKATIMVYNMNGQMIYTHSIQGLGSHSLETNLSPALYLVRYQSQSNSFSKKIIFW